MRSARTTYLGNCRTKTYDARVIVIIDSRLPERMAIWDGKDGTQKWGRVGVDGARALCDFELTYWNV